MCLKSVIRHALKYVPASPDLLIAMEHDEENQIDFAAAKTKRLPTPANPNVFDALMNKPAAPPAATVPEELPSDVLPEPEPEPAPEPPAEQPVRRGPGRPPKAAAKPSPEDEKAQAQKEKAVAALARIAEAKSMGTPWDDAFYIEGSVNSNGAEKTALKMGVSIQELYDAMEA
jgi:hypothetical protein